MLRPSPFLHIDADRVYDPLSDRALTPADEAYALFRHFQSTGEADAGLEAEGWLVAADADLSRKHRLKVVSLETTTTCNQKCYFCPVAIAPRDGDAMPDEMLGRSVNRLTIIPALVSVLLQGYN